MIKNDIWIREVAKQGMITPFQSDLIRQIEDKKMLSFGCSSYGYDIRLSSKQFLVFRHIPGTVVDPKNFNPDNLEPTKLYQDENGSYFILPAHSYGLGVALERLAIPDNITVICIGKSTYARCFTENTKVKLVNGDFTFTQLIEMSRQGKKLYGYGVKDGEIIVQELIKPRYIEHSKIIRVHLDNKQFIECTPDHKFLMRNGSSVPASELKPLDSLYPIYQYSSHGYPAIFDAGLALSARKRLAGFKVVHRMVASDILKADLNLHVHHLDSDVNNNHPDNIKMITATEHAEIHNKEHDHASLGGQAFKAKWDSDDNFKEYICSRLHSEEAKAKQQKAIESRVNSEENIEALANFRKERWKSDEQRRKQSEVAKRGIGALKRRDDITEETLSAALLKAGTIRGAARLLKVDRRAFNRFPVVMENFKAGTLANNHKVAYIETIEIEQPVYCLTAPDTGNFALSAGVFVENCGIIANLTPAEAAWRGHLTLEFSNSSSADCRIYAGEGICQLLFLEGEPCEVSYETRAGKYQDQPEQVVLSRV